MKCPRCGHNEDKVIDSRLSRLGAAIRRRRECQDCRHRFTTIEQIVPSEIHVVKRDGNREDFNPQKIRDGIELACNKLRVREDQVDAMMQHITQRLEELGKTEISSEDIGRMVMAELEDFNDVAYVRFASVYRQFRDIEEFIQEIRLLSERHK